CSFSKPFLCSSQRLAKDFSATSGISRYLPQPFLKKVLSKKFFILPLKKSIIERFFMPRFQSFQPKPSLAVFSPATAASLRFNNNILCMSILTGQTSEHLPHKLEA